ncbi:NUMOD1 domain-containing DNA-binding protein [Algoriphagus sp. D3-2-R+10]|uniref:NUMOD1 domain-containing DNA-binding protein n=1 Tax=Algoriphagus aurantiacus TaxID=3103948 RepID=UPI002B381486|nr:NUMOD1 domain-containing DNA-binding protein [Algoriphagus sp. D3-2-R+10]MEB2775250.1 NUMOD1 domain-containing DNA-binding protein [Algoriphagus sp. D3-2-R+10]
MKNKKNKNVFKYDLDGNYIKGYISVAEATEETNVASSSIYRNITNHKKSAGGFIWSYEKLQSVPSRYKKIYQYNLDGNFLNEYKSILEASKKLNIKYYGISQNAKGYTKFFENYIWSFVKMDKVQPVVKKIIYQYDFEGNLINQFESVKEASKFSGILGSNISHTLYGRADSAGGFIWSFRNDIPVKYNYKFLYQYDLDGNFIKEFKSISEASKETNILASSITQNAKRGSKSAGGFVWRYTKKDKIGNCNLNKIIYQYTKKGEFIKEYNSVKNASIETSVSYSSIYQNVKGKTKTAGGFIWSFEKKDVLKNITSKDDVSNIIINKEKNGYNISIGNNKIIWISEELISKFCK